MITPTLNDLNRKVIYHRDTPEEKIGIISSINGRYVYVQYGRGPASEAAIREDLSWPEAL